MKGHRSGMDSAVGYNSVNDRLKDLEKEEREWVRDQEKKEEELEKIKIVR